MKFEKGIEKGEQAVFDRSILAERRKHVFIGNGFTQSQTDGGRQAQSKQDFTGDSAGGQPERTETKNAGGREILPLRP